MSMFEVGGGAVLFPDPLGCPVLWNRKVTGSRPVATVKCNLGQIEGKTTLNDCWDWKREYLPGNTTWSYPNIHKKIKVDNRIVLVKVFPRMNIAFILIEIAALRKIWAQKGLRAHENIIILWVFFFFLFFSVSFSFTEMSVIYSHFLRCKMLYVHFLI